MDHLGPGALVIFTSKNMRILGVGSRALYMVLMVRVSAGFFFHRAGGSTSRRSRHIPACSPHLLAIKLPILKTSVTRSSTNLC